MLGQPPERRVNGCQEVLAEHREKIPGMPCEVMREQSLEPSAEYVGI